MAGVMREDSRFWPLLTELASCLCAEIAAAGLPEPCFCGVVPGDAMALDYCTDCGEKCGMAWVRVVSMNVADVGIEGGNPCTAPLEATIEVGVARCAPMPDDQGNPPSMADQLEATRVMMADQAAALRAIRCCSSRDFDVQQWAPAGPQGGCVGGAWSVIFAEA